MKILNYLKGGGLTIQGKESTLTVKKSRAARGTWGIFSIEGTPCALSFLNRQSALTVASAACTGTTDQDEANIMARRLERHLRARSRARVFSPFLKLLSRF